MGKEWPSILIGLGVEIIITILGVVVKNVPMPVTIIFVVVGLALIIFGVVSLIRRSKKMKEDEGKEELTIIKDAKVKLNAKNADKATGMEVTTPTELNNIDVNVSAENVKEATGFRSIQTNKPNALFAATVICSCGKRFTYTSAGYKPKYVRCPHCGQEHEVH